MCVTPVVTLNGGEATTQGLFLESQSLNPHSLLPPLTSGVQGASGHQPDVHKSSAVTHRDGFSVAAVAHQLIHSESGTQPRARGCLAAAEQERRWACGCDAFIV